MHPALSVIFFTVTSGAGFGFIALIGIGVPLPNGGIGAFAAALLGCGLAVAGLVSSTFHLGHPERAWRAFSQWRSSWLSREGVLAVLTLTLFGVYAFFWVFFSQRIGLLGGVVALGAVLTIYATAMIYAQLKTVPSWNTVLTPACYLLFALVSGVLIAGSFGYWKSVHSITTPVMALVLLGVAWSVKLAWWANLAADTLEARGSSAETATGLGFVGTVRLLEKPHSGESYLTREMVHKVGRKHAKNLRRLALVVGAVLPLVICLLVAIFTLPNHLLALAFLFLMAGLFVERWLFFAEARHAVSLYY